MENFKELNLSPALSTAIDELGYTAPTPIQAQTLPLLLAGPTDFLGLAATGTGKTAAFGIPLLEQLNNSRREVQALVLCPTRELALQVTEQLNLLGKHKKLRAVPVYGGAGYGDQIRGLRQGAQIVVATPGRLIDHLERGTISLDKVETVVLDEADEMISMGFKDELESILEMMPAGSYKTWLFSATMSRDVRRVADKFLTEPKMVQVNKTEMLSGTVRQIYYKVKESDKADILCKLIDMEDGFYGLIFCQTKSLVMDLTTLLTSRGYKVDCLHGDKDQNQRERTMRAFKERRVSILVCTDVASRGIDVKDLTHVINYSIPRELDNYVHRIGRTGRSGKQGVALSLVTPSHQSLVGRLEKMTQSKMELGTIPTRKDIGLKKISNLLTRFQSVESHVRVEELLTPEWQAALEGMTKTEIAARLLTLTFADIFIDREKSGVAQMPGKPAFVADPRGERRSRAAERGERKFRERPSIADEIEGVKPYVQPNVVPLEDKLEAVEPAVAESMVAEPMVPEAPRIEQPSIEVAEAELPPVEFNLEDEVLVAELEVAAEPARIDVRPLEKPIERAVRETSPWERKPRREFGDKPRREYGERPRREYGERPRRSFGDEPRREYGDRPRRSFSDEPRREYGERPRRSFDDKPRREYGERPRRAFDDKPRREFGERPRRAFDDKPRREVGERPPRREFGERPRRDFDEKPRRAFGDKPRFERGRDERPVRAARQPDDKRPRGGVVRGDHESSYGYDGSRTLSRNRKVW